LKHNYNNKNFLTMLTNGQVVNVHFFLLSPSTDVLVIDRFALEIENEFKLKLHDCVTQLDSEEAVLLAQLEKDLNVRQESILESARKRIDDHNEEPNRLKMVHLQSRQTIRSMCEWFLYCFLF
jgi:hypothetical protein